MLQSFYSKNYIFNFDHINFASDCYLKNVLFKKIKMAMIVTQNIRYASLTTFKNFKKNLHTFLRLILSI